MKGHRPGRGERDFNAELRADRGGSRSGRSRAVDDRRNTARCGQRGRGSLYFNETLRRSATAALALSVVVKARRCNSASSAERRLSLIASVVIREDGAPLVERFPLVHIEPSRITGAALEGPREDRKSVV